MMDIMTAFKIKNLRLSGMSQVDVAKKLSIHRRTVIRCENRGFKATEKKLQIADRHSRFVECLDSGTYVTRVRDFNYGQMSSTQQKLYNYEFTGTEATLSGLTPEELYILEQELSNEDEN